MTRNDRIAKAIIDAIADEWIKQGHDMDGTAISKLFHTVEEAGVETIFRIYDGTKRGYMGILDKGVSADRIPYTPGQRRADRSEYIKGLIRFFKHPSRGGLSDEEALSAAFATARKHAKEGMPTRASYRPEITKTGNRINFVADGTKDIMNEINEIMQEAFREAVMV
jgi:hypothetical protein